LNQIEADKEFRNQGKTTIMELENENRFIKEENKRLQGNFENLKSELSSVGGKNRELVSKLNQIDELVRN
jgi:hypothetical protein